MAVMGPLEMAPEVELLHPTYYNCLGGQQEQEFFKTPPTKLGDFEDPTKHPHAKKKRFIKQTPLMIWRVPAS